MDQWGRRWRTARGGGDGFAGDWGRCCGSGANTSHRGSTFPMASNGTQVARDPIGLLDRLNGRKAPPPSSAPIYSDAVSWTRRPASASQVGGCAQEGPEACATTPVVENQKYLYHYISSPRRSEAMQQG